MKKTKIAAALIFTLSMGLVSGCGNLSVKQESETSDGKITIQTDDEATATDADATEEDVKSSDLLNDEEVQDKISEIQGYIDSMYYFDIDKDTEEEALYDGIMSGLDDPYSVYYTAEEYAELMEEDSGEYFGVGAVVTQGEDDLVTVVRPIEGSPAEEAGILAGDIITEVDGTEIDGQDLSIVVDMIRGEEGTTAHIQVYRQSEKQYLEFDIKRANVQNVTVSSEVLDNNIGYIQVEQFYENTDEEFEEKFADLESQGVDGIIIDLRDNPGGLLDTVINMCDYILDSGDIVTIKDKDGNIVKEYQATSDHSEDIPMVVLVNGNSASASEIFTGAMKDTGKAEIVGTNTFGKGIVQSVIPLSDGTAIKLTVAKYFTPNGNDIHKKGIAPDYEVELADDRTNAVNLDREDDLQLQKAEEVMQDLIK